jgi:hypothetical protein
MLNGQRTACRFQALGRHRAWLRTTPAATASRVAWPSGTALVYLVCGKDAMSWFTFGGSLLNMKRYQRGYSFGR